jgi:glutamyl-tRNA reductase
LAYHQLKKINLPLNARILIIGSGTTNTTMGRFLKKHGFRNFVIFNRTLNNAQVLAKELQCEAFALSELINYKKGFDLILSCTGADHHVISPSLYTDLLQGETEKKTIIDIAIPQDLSPSIIEKYAVNHISVDFLQKISNQNLKERGKEVEHVLEIISAALQEFEFILKERSVEIAMKSVPSQVKEIKKNAVNAVFKDEIEGMDEHSKKVLKKVIGYMEKKYISGPMKLAKEIILKNAN